MYPRTLLQLKLRVEYVPSLPPRHLNLIPGCVWSLAAGCNAGCMGEQSLFTHASPPSLSKRESTATTASCHIRRGHEKGGIGSRSVETLRLRGFVVFFFFFLEVRRCANNYPPPFFFCSSNERILFVPFS